MSDEARKDGCDRNITPGESCAAPILTHPCLYQDGDFFLQCPHNNIIFREPRLLNGIWQQKCRICEFASDELIDTDKRPGWIQTRLRFGAMSFLGRLDESMISGYGVFIADNCSRPLKRGILHFEPKNAWSSYDRWDCCNPTVYDIHLELEIPPGFHSVFLMVIPNTTDIGFLPVGPVSMEIMDYNETVEDGGMRMSLSFGSILMLCMSILAPHVS